MREIKFRVWNGSEMVYDVVVGKFGAFYVNPGNDGDGLDQRDKACLSSSNTKFSQGTPVMQYTGLKDKNGKEIYEGDIVRQAIDNGSSTQFFEVEYFYQDINMAETMGWNLWTLAEEYGGTIGGLSQEIEIIGNIYENPELLEKNEDA